MFVKSRFGKTSFTALLAFAGALVTGYTCAADPDKIACAAAGEEGHELKRNNKLLEAQRVLRVCANESCGALAPECVRWLNEIEISLPTVVIEAHDPTGAETNQVAVAIDGHSVLRRLDGNAIPLDPGLHRFRFELDGGQVQEQEVLARTGEKNRKILVAFPATPAPPRRPGNGARPGPNRTPAFIAFGVGAVGAAVGVVTGIVAIQKNDRLEDVCSAERTCPETEVGTRDTLKTMSILSTVGFGAAAIATGIGVTLLISASASPSKPRGVSLAAEPLVGRMSGIELHGRF